jgi:hypothetical protein
MWQVVFSKSKTRDQLAYIRIPETGTATSMSEEHLICFLYEASPECTCNLSPIITSSHLKLGQKQCPGSGKSARIPPHANTPPSNFGTLKRVRCNTVSEPMSLCDLLRTCAVVKSTCQLSICANGNFSIAGSSRIWNGGYPPCRPSLASVLFPPDQL